MMPVDGVLNLMLYLSRPIKLSQMTTQGDGVRSPLAMKVAMPVDGAMPLNLNPNLNPILAVADGVTMLNPNLNLNLSPSLSPRTAMDGATRPLRRARTTGAAEVAGGLPDSLVRAALEVVCKVDTVVVAGEAEALGESVIIVERPAIS